LEPSWRDSETLSKGNRHPTVESDVPDALPIEESPKRMRGVYACASPTVCNKATVQEVRRLRDGDASAVKVLTRVRQRANVCSVQLEKPGAALLRLHEGWIVTEAR
jgi:hypothetical protein